MMQVLLIRRDADGSAYYEVYDNNPESMDLMSQNALSHLNTIGVAEVTLLPVEKMNMAHLRRRHDAH